MRILKIAAALSLVALTASPTYAAMHRKRHMRSVNGATSAQPTNGNHKTTRTGGPAGGTSNE